MKKTTTEAELRDWIAQGKTHGQIADLLGRHPSSIAVTCAILGVSAKGSKGRGPDLPAYLADMRSGMTIAAIAKKHGKCVSSINAALKRAGLPTSARALLVQEAIKNARNTAVPA